MERRVKYEKLLCKYCKIQFRKSKGKYTIYKHGKDFTLKCMCCGTRFRVKLELLNDKFN